MPKDHARKKEVRRRMKETGRGYQSTARERHQENAHDMSDSSSLPNADRREDYIDALWDADLPQKVKVLLYELASRLDVNASDWTPDNHHVRFGEEELASAVGLDIEAANLCRYLAIEANWLVEVNDEVVELRQPHEDWNTFQSALAGLKKPIIDQGRYRSCLDALAKDVERLRTEPMMSVRRIQEAMVTVIGHTYLPKCIGGELSKNTMGLGSGHQAGEL
ncbi:hypothetical protein ACFV84_24820 [Kitasatospora sp. NPDC059811]|uniref:hypothetical protein n=1 Tax=Streptomycetaceae TaxID=2062 RepID=UPI00133179A6|nr:hypothetical protein [Streptomyces sp. MJM8645]